MNKKVKIKNFPISFFSVILGMMGFTVASQKMESTFGVPQFLSPALLYVAVACFAFITTCYILKIIYFPKDVLKEFNHPVKISFFPTFSVALLLLSTALVSEHQLLSKYIWCLGTVIHIIFTLSILSIWIQHTKFEITHMSPAWFIPVVGNILIPIAGVAHFNKEISLFFFSLGFTFWIVLMVIFFNRIIFFHPLPEKLLPTLFILIAPPAIGCVSLFKLTGSLTTASKIMYYVAFFLASLLIVQAKMFYAIKYYLSWWAYSFPIAAFTIASFLMFHQTGYVFFKYVALFSFSFLSVLIVVLAIKTVRALMRGEICVEEAD